MSTLFLVGESWDECNQSALATAERKGMTYIHPFDDCRGDGGSSYHRA